MRHLMLVLVAMSAALWIFPTASHAQENNLAGTQWQLVSYGDPNAPTPVHANVVTLDFQDDNQVAGMGGCNSYGGSYTVEGETITFTEIFSTLMACVDEQLMQQEQIYLEALQTANRYEVTDHQLTIWYGENQQLVFTSGDSTFEVEWQLVSYGSPDNLTEVITDSTVTLQLINATEIAGSGGCNTYSGTYIIENDTITFSDIASTKMACADDQIMQQEQAFFEALAAVTRYEIADSQLTLWYGEDQQLNFVDKTLVGTQWRLVSYGDPDALTSAIGMITLDFLSETELAGSGGCNSYSATYTLENDMITLSPIIRTEIACRDAANMQQEQSYFEALQAVDRIEHNGNQLTLWYGENQLNFATFGTEA